LKSYSRGLVAAGLVLIMVSFLFVFPYVGYTVNRQYANVTVAPITMTGLDPQNPVNLYIFVVLFFGGVGLLVKGLFK
jgi:hypothetical protein